MSQSGVLYERLESLERSRRGHLASITKECNELDESLKDFSNVVKVRTLQTQLNTAWEQYCVCCDKCANLLDSACEKYQSVLSDCAAQRSLYEFTMIRLNSLLLVLPNFTIVKCLKMLNYQRNFPRLNL